MRIPLFCILVILIFTAYPGYSQSLDSSMQRPQQVDTSISPFVQLVKEAGERDKQRSQAKYEGSKIRLRQQAIWDALIQSVQEVKLYLANGLYLDRITSEIDLVKTRYKIVQEGIFINPGSAQTDRNLYVSSAILFQLINATEDNKRQLDKYAASLAQYRNTIDSLISDPVVYIFPTDSIQLVKYLSRLKILASEGNPSDNALDATLDSALALQNSVDNLLYTLKSTYDQIERLRSKLSATIWQREFAGLWQQPASKRPFSEILHFSLIKERMAIGLYVQENIFALFLLICCAAVICALALYLKNKLKEEERFAEQIPLKLVLKHPVASSLLITLCVYQFAFINAPFIFSFCIWTLSICCLLVLFRQHITPFWNNFWIILSALFLITCLDNFLLQASRPERWFMAILSLSGILFGIFFILNRKRSPLKEHYIILFLYFMVIAEILSLTLNILGRYNLSKALLVAGYTGIVNAILFLWVIRLINEGLGLGASLYKHPERGLWYINFRRLGSKAPTILYVLLAIGWCVLVGRHFYAFKSIAIPFNDLLQKSRTIGDYSFTINGLALFLLIITCSMILSRIISFFTADPLATHSATANVSPKVAPGSWILLIRILIISLGLFLAFAATGLPLDKITIVLGALSVGIGLGLQGLVSNLVSGLIIAFEKPMNVGDLIEVNGKAGTMKSIGFRSSVVSLGDGSHLIVPNSDLLNNHLVNWSNRRGTRKMTIPLQVAYGSDLNKVKTLVEELTNQQNGIAKAPRPTAIPAAFSENSVHINLVVWINDLNESLNIVGDLIIAIDNAFQENGISRPYSRQDVHLHADRSGDNLPGTL